MTLNGQIAHPLDKAAIREPFLARRFCLRVLVRGTGAVYAGLCKALDKIILLLEK